jgi:hypothetical protein
MLFVFFFDLLEIVFLGFQFHHILLKLDKLSFRVQFNVMRVDSPFFKFGCLGVWPMTTSDPPGNCSWISQSLLPTSLSVCLSLSIYFFISLSLSFFSLSLFLILLLLSLATYLFLFLSTSLCLCNFSLFKKQLLILKT